MATASRPRFALWMALSVALVTALALWDEERESRAALEDFAQEQMKTAAVAAAGLRAQLGTMSTAEALASPSLRLIPGAPWLAAGGGIVLLHAPTDSDFRTLSNGRLSAPELLASLRSGQTWMLLRRAQAARLGLVERTAVAGLASVQDPGGARWGVAVVTSAARERDREKRARWRLALGVLVVTALVIGFGGTALRTQKHEFQLEQALARAELQRERERQLATENRAAVMVALAGGVAHEISTPLGVISGRAEQLVEKVAADERARKAVDVILEQIGRVREVIRGLLNLARGDVPALARVDAADVVAGAVALVEHRFATAGVQLSVRTPLPSAHVRGDLRLLEQVLVNLLLNACDATPRGTAVEVVLECDEHEVRMAVLDEGAGIAPDDVARMLEPFFTTKPAGQGSGLGLAIANEIVKIHRGTLTLAPREPHGTRADVHIPLAETDERT